MPPLRTLPAVPVALALLVLAPSASSAPTAPATDAVLPLLVTDGGAPAAALLAQEESGTRYAQAGLGISASDHFRAGSITKTFVATVVLQLAAGHRLSLSDTVEKHLPCRVRGAGNDGARADPACPAHPHQRSVRLHRRHRGMVPLPPRQAVRLALTRPPADRGRFACSTPAPHTARTAWACFPCGTTVWGHNGIISGSYVRTAATVDGRRVLTYRVNTTAVADPGIEPRLLTAEFCPRTR